MTSTIKRPKSDGRCIHCREVLVKATGDHVFPSSWYPDVTPSNIQWWKAPSCKRCNGQFGAMEQDLLVRFGLCIDPRKAAASGISKKALSALGISKLVHLATMLAGPDSQLQPRVPFCFRVIGIRRDTKPLSRRFGPKRFGGQRSPTSESTTFDPPMPPD